MKPNPAKTRPAKAASLTSPGPAIERESDQSPLEKESTRKEQALSDILASIDLDVGRAVLRRRTITDTEFAFLADIPAKGFTEAMIAQVYGGGEYKVQFHVNNKFAGNNQFKIDFAIPSKYPGVAKDEPKKESDIAVIVSTLPTLIANALPKGDGGMATMLPLMMKMMETQSTQMVALFTGMMTRNTGPDPGVTALTAIMADMKGELKALAAHKGGSGDGFESFLTKFGKFQELMGELGVGAAAGGGEATGKPDRVAQLLEAFGPSANLLLQKALNLQQEQQQPQQIQTVSTPIAALPAPSTPAVIPVAASVTTPKADAGAAPSSTSNPDKQMSPILAGYIIQFRSWALLAAKKQRDPEEWVDDKIDELPKLAHQAVFDLANKETWFKDVFGPAPEAIDHVTWLNEMRKFVLLRWFCQEVTKASALKPRPEAKTFAATLADAASISFQQEIFDRCAPDLWANLFEEMPIDQVWLEELRAAMEHELQTADEPDDGKPEATNPTPETTEKTNTAKKDATPKKASGS